VRSVVRESLNGSSGSNAGSRGKGVPSAGRPPRSCPPDQRNGGQRLLASEVPLHGVHGCVVACRQSLAKQKDKGPS
jgi:hypothetical protein